MKSRPIDFKVGETFRVYKALQRSVGLNHSQMKREYPELFQLCFSTKAKLEKQVGNS